MNPVISVSLPLVTRITEEEMKEDGATSVPSYEAASNRKKGKTSFM